MVKGENERLLYEILNDAYPGKWKSDFQGIEATGIMHRKVKGEVREYEYKRRFAFDCANPSDKIAIEIDGGIWMPKGAHNTGIAITKDMEKLNLAVLEGWRILRYTPETLKKRPYKIIKDVRLLCGSNTHGQTLLCFDDVSTGKIQIQQRL